MGKKEERLNHLIETVKKKNGTTVKELSSVLKVSEMTVRRDLEFLKYSDVLIIILKVLCKKRIAVIYCRWRRRLT